MRRVAAPAPTAAGLLLIGAVACGHSGSGPVGDLHFPTTLEAVEYIQTGSGCDGSGNADALRSHSELLVVDENSLPVEHLRLPSGVVRDGRCVFSVRVELPAGVHELWLATRGGSARTVPLANRRHAQHDGSSISVTITSKHG